jgi:hypothetical protein
MLTKPVFAVTVVSVVLFIYSILILLNSPIAYFIFSVSPILLIWVSYIIIRFGMFKGKELKADEEWGYEDRDKEELGLM